MRRDEVADLLHYDPDTGALTWRETGASAVVPTPTGPHVAIFRQSFAAVRVVWWIAHRRIPPRVTFLNGDCYDLRMSNMRYLSLEEYRAHNRALKEERARAASATRKGIPKGVTQCRASGLYYARVLVRGRIEETKHVADPREAYRLRRALTLKGNTQTPR